MSSKVNLIAVQNPFSLGEERSLFKFTQEADFQRWRTFQDKDIGGKSTISIEPSLDHPVPLHQPLALPWPYQPLSLFARP